MTYYKIVYFYTREGETSGEQTWSKDHLQTIEEAREELQRAKAWHKKSEKFVEGFPGYERPTIINYKIIEVREQEIEEDAQTVKYF
jgi:hypothetical protein